MKRMKYTFGLLLTLVTAGFTIQSFAAFNQLHSFGAGQDGRWPSSRILYTGGYLYGVTPYGGVSNCGTFFRMDTNGASYTVLRTFDEATGRFPLGGLCEYGGRFYGMTSRGGSQDDGVLFSMLPNGTDYTVEYTFADDDADNASFPWGGLVEYNGYLYGMTFRGGSNSAGTVIRYNPSGGTLALLHHFGTGEVDGTYPQGDLISDGAGTLYGMTAQGGFHGCGTIFSMESDGSGYTVLYEFTGNADGANPSGRLLLDDNKLYGMTRQGTYKGGSIFSYDLNTTALTVLHEFTGEAADGADPYGGLVQYDGALFGLTRFGGTYSQGTVFRLGGSYTNVHSFENGGEPYGDLTLIGDRFYGMAFHEGDSFEGCVFGLDADGGSEPEAWAAMTWIEDGEFSDTWLGSENSQLMYVQHNTDGGVPDEAYIGYGLTSNADDETWTWRAMGKRDGLFGDDDNYEYTGTLGRVASTGTYFVAAKFVKGIHVYYTKAGLNDWGNWNTALYATNTYTVKPLVAPSGLSYTYYSGSNTLDLTCSGDGEHWILVFRKDGAMASMTAPDNDTVYEVGTVYPEQGTCVYKGAAGNVLDTDVIVDDYYTYAFYTENWNYYSSGSELSVQAAQGSNPDGDDDGDGVPNWWEMQYFGSFTGMVAGVDTDGDGMLDSQEYISATDPLNDEDYLAMLSDFTPGSGGTEYGVNMLANPGFDSGTGSWTFDGNAKVESWASHTGDNGAILSGQWVSGGADNFATISQQTAAVPGQEYQAGGYFKRESQWGLPTAIKLVFLNASQAQLTVKTNSLTGLSAGNWTEVLISETAPSGTAYARMIVEASQIENWDSDGTFFVDDMILQTVTAQDSDTFSASWTMKTNRSYWVDTCVNLKTAEWVNLATNLSAGSEQSYTLNDTNVQAIKTRKYRLGVKIP